MAREVENLRDVVLGPEFIIEDFIPDEIRTSITYPLIEAMYIDEFKCVTYEIDGAGAFAFQAIYKRRGHNIAYNNPEYPSIKH